MAWRLGIDLGTNSLGWAALELRDEGNGVLVPCRLTDASVRIFSDGRNPKDKQSNAVKRREPRSARRNRDRYKRRRARLMRQLVEFGLMPKDETARKALEGGKGSVLADTDPWILRARGLHEEISLHQLGRTLFHLHQRRGFKSNRKMDPADGESGKVYDAIKRTKEKLAQNDASTIGELFGKERLKNYLENQKTTKGSRKPQPLARVRSRGSGSKMQYDYYPTRELVLDEFDLLWDAQRQFHGSFMTEDTRAALRDTIEWQHELKPQPVGKCTLMPNFERAPKALPSSQRARIFQEVNNLRVMPTGKASYLLTKEERDIITESLLRPTNKTAKRTFDQLRKLMGLSSYDSFNLESGKRKDLVGDETAARLMQDDRWGKTWFDLELATQDEIVDRLINEEKEEVLVDWLCATHDLEREQAYRVADCPLPDGHGSLSRKALDRIIPHLETGMIYADAATLEFGDHRPLGDGEVHDLALPYYGYVLERSVAFGTGKPEDTDEKRYGKIANPNVHVALNQVRAVINDLIKRFGAPEQIVLELARDLPLSAKGKSELEATHKKNREANERRAKELDEVYGGQPNTYENRMRLRLYEELEALGKRCVFTGQQIGPHNLFSPEVEIEHILPFSQTFDDGFNNKTLSMRQANRDKGNQTPHGAFSHSPPGYNWEEISKRAAEFPPGKRWRFNPDAMERYEKFEGGFLARQLTDTQYISRLAKAYLESIYGGQGHQGSKNNVWVINGRLTADLRHHWGLNSVLLGDNLPESEAQKKNRNDHRHHAIDAIVVAGTDRSMLQKAAGEAQENERQFSDRLLAGTPPPWEGFRSDVENTVRKIVVSHKPDHGFQGAIFNDSAMSLIKIDGHENEISTIPLVKKYIPIDSLEAKHLDPGNKKTWTVVDQDIRLELSEITAQLNDKDFKKTILEWSNNRKPQVNRLRVYKRETVFGISHKNNEDIYKYYTSAGNYCFDIWIDQKGIWQSEIITTADAYKIYQKTGNQEWWSDLKGLDGKTLILRIRKGDLLQIIDRDGRQKIVCVYKFSNGNVHMYEHYESNASDRILKKDITDIKMATSTLQKSFTKRVTVSPSGVLKVYN